MDKDWTDFTIHENTAKPRIGQVGDLIDVRYFEVTYSGLRWHRDVFIITEQELAMNWCDWQNMAIVCYRIQRANTATAQTMRALHQLAHNPISPVLPVRQNRTVSGQNLIEARRFSTQPSTMKGSN